jgi:hypothetical protein
MRLRPVSAEKQDAAFKIGTFPKDRVTSLGSMHSR